MYWLFFLQIPATSTDLCENDQNPFTSNPDEFHGTAVTGEIVGARSNGQCGTGIAYNARVGSKFDISELLITSVKCFSLCL